MQRQELYRQSRIQEPKKNGLFSEKGFLFMLTQQGRQNTKTTLLFALLLVALSTIALIAYANSQGCVIACYNDSGCDDNNPFTIDVCNNDATCESKCTNIATCEVACSKDKDCDDQNPETVDVCNNDATCEAECTNMPLQIIETPIETPIDLNYPDLNDLAFYLSFDEADGNGDLAFDFSRGKAHGRYFGRASRNAEGKGGTRAASFEGLDDHISIPTSRAVGGKLVWTISFWFKTSSVYSNGFYWEDYFVNEGAGGDFSYVTIDIFPNDWGIWAEYYNRVTGEYHHFGCDEPYSPECHLGYDDDEWHHLAWVRNNSDWALYLDGQLVETDSTYVTPIAAEADFVHVGEGYSGGLSTLMEDFKIYNRAPTAEEINREYNQ